MSDDLEREIAALRRMRQFHLSPEPAQVRQVQFYAASDRLLDRAVRGALVAFSSYELDDYLGGTADYYFTGVVDPADLTRYAGAPWLDPGLFLIALDGVAVTPIFYRHIPRQPDLHVKQTLNRLHPRPL